MAAPGWRGVSHEPPVHLPVASDSPAGRDPGERSGARLWRYAAPVGGTAGGKQRTEPERRKTSRL